MYWVVALIGLVSLAAPFLFDFREDASAFWTSMILGVSLLVVSGLEALAADRERWEYWVIGIVGFGAIAAPFVLGFTDHIEAMWTTVAVGTIAVLASGTRLLVKTT